MGDGIFKSAGNVRATGKFTLLVPDMESGDAVELVGAGKYTNTRPERRLRLDYAHSANEAGVRHPLLTT